MKRFHHFIQSQVWPYRMQCRFDRVARWSGTRVCRTGLRDCRDTSSHHPSGEPPHSGTSWDCQLSSTCCTSHIHALYSGPSWCLSGPWSHFRLELWFLQRKCRWGDEGLGARLSGHLPLPCWEWSLHVHHWSQVAQEQMAFPQLQAQGLLQLPLLLIISRNHPQGHLQLLLLALQPLRVGSSKPRVVRPDLLGALHSLDFRFLSFIFNV